MTEKLLRGHHIKNLGLAIQLGWLAPAHARKRLSYILDGSMDEEIRIIAGGQDQVCKWCSVHCKKEYLNCQWYETSYAFAKESKELDESFARIWGFEVGEVVKAREFIERLRSIKYFFSRMVRTYDALNIYMQTNLPMKTIIDEADTPLKKGGKEYGS